MSEVHCLVRDEKCVSSVLFLVLRSFGYEVYVKSFCEMEQSAAWVELLIFSYLYWLGLEEFSENADLE